MKVIKAHSRKFLITHFTSLFESLSIFNEYKKKDNKDLICFKSCSFFKGILPIFYPFVVMQSNNLHRFLPNNF